VIKSLIFKQAVLLIILMTLIFSSYKALGQKGNLISDFYEFANKDWLDTTSIPEKCNVVNNWGILWNKIIDKSTEILSGDLEYELDEDNYYMLIQLQNFYKSAAEKIPEERKRVYFIQQYYPLIFGTIFSEITIPNKKEELIKELIHYLSLAFKQKIENSEHIEEKNTDFFISILNNMQFEIGAPDISSLPKMPVLTVNSLETNIQLTEEFHEKINSKKLNWESAPFETDCRYNYKSNVVKIYAGILFNSSTTNTPEELFATIGRTVAHEMTHAFDKYGRKFNKKDWKDINNSLIDQFNQYSIQGNYFVDGNKTLQENFADLSGVEISLLALHLYLKDYFPSYSEKKKLDIVRNYFLVYAEFWREKSTLEFEISSLKRVHAPQKYRAIGSIYNQTEFYETFKVDTKSRYYISESNRISIW